MTLIRQFSTRAAARQLLRPRTVAQQPKHGQRCYATNGSPGAPNPQNQRNLMIAAAVAIPAAYYFWTRSDSKKGDISGKQHGANQEYKKGAEGNN